MVVSDLIEAAYSKLAIGAAGETLDSGQYSTALKALQSMLRSWASENLLVFASTKESFSLVPGTFLYTWGATGTINTLRPNQVIGASIVDSSGITHPVEIVSESKYRAVALKTTIARPYILFFQPTYPLANVYLYPVPDTVELAYLDSFKPFTETSSFDVTTATLAFPLNYEEPMIYNLAIRLASSFGKAIPAEVSGIAGSGYNRLITLNSANQVESVPIFVPAGTVHGTRYSINSDSYH